LGVSLTFSHRGLRRRGRSAWFFDFDDYGEKKEEKYNINMIITHSFISYMGREGKGGEEKPGNGEEERKSPVS
jgi:hypothetical protein